MDLTPHEELRPENRFNSTPMIDFLFIMLALFATLAISRKALYDSEIELAKLNHPSDEMAAQHGVEIQQINLSVKNDGSYKWITEFQEVPMENVQEIQEEISRQYQIGALLKDKSKSEILLHIDHLAPWQPIADLIFGVREIGFSVHPVYELKDDCREATEKDKLF